MKRLVLAVLFAIGVGLAHAALASTFKLESMTIILNEADGEAVFNIENTGAEPILLLSTLENLSGDDTVDRLLLSPPITRIDAGDTQMVRISLKSGPALSEERMVKASFEGVVQSEGGSRMSMPLRQDIGLIVQPRRVPVVARPWEDVRWRVEDGELVLHNTGKHIVRAASQVQLFPVNQALQIGQMYLRPGETLRRKLPDGVTGVQQVKLVPLSRHAFALPEVELVQDAS